MMKVINEAYAVIQDAPLCYHMERAYPPVSEKGSYAAGRSSTRRHRDAGVHKRRLADYVGLWVRFICGALLGTLMSLNLGLYFVGHPVVLIAGGGGLILGCGWGAAKYGDKIWYELLGP